MPLEQHLSRRSFIKLALFGLLVANNGCGTDPFPAAYKEASPVGAKTDNTDRPQKDPELRIEELLGADNFEQVKTLKIPHDISQQLIDLAKTGKLFFKQNYPAVICESEFLNFWAIQNASMRQNLLNAYADGIIKGIARIYSPRMQLVVGLEIGHLSIPPMAKINEINDKREMEGLQKLFPTEDSGAKAETAEGEKIYEREVNFKLGHLIAQKITREYPLWFPVLSSNEPGYHVDRLIRNIGRDEEFYIRHHDAMLPLKYYWEKLASKVRKTSVGMILIAIHFNDVPGQEFQDGVVIPQNFGRFAELSLRTAYAISENLKVQVRQHIPDYMNSINTELNTIENPYWTLDSIEDSEEDVRSGNSAKIKSAANKLVVRMRAAA